MTATRIPLSVYCPLSEAARIIADTTGSSEETARSMLESNDRAPKGFSMPDLSNDERCFVRASIRGYAEALKRRASGA